MPDVSPSPQRDPFGEFLAADPVGFPVSSPRKFQDRLWLHAALFLATALTTTFVGLLYYVSYLGEFGAKTVTFDWRSFGFGGWFSVSLLAIMTAHEFGHYVACRYYRIDASLPYYLPMIPALPLGTLTGTLGAVIKIREPILKKHALFDIGIAGPIAGFVLAIPVLFAGLALSTVAPVPKNLVGIEFGEPLAFQFAQWLVKGTLPAGSGLNAHPMAMAGWWGLFVTAFNLIPAFQLDGGHIAYAVLGRRSAWLTFAVLGAMAALSFTSSGWIALTVILAVLIYFFGAHHPPVMDEHLPLSRGRRALALFALVMFAVSFTPAPIEILGLGGR